MDTNKEKLNATPDRNENLNKATRHLENELLTMDKATRTVRDIINYLLMETGKNPKY